MSRQASHGTCQNSGLKDQEIAKMHQPSPNSRQDFLVQFLKKIYSPLSKSDRPYVDTSELNSMGIKCLHMDFYTGRLSKGIMPFIDPIPTSKIEEWLDDTKPWLDRDDFFEGSKDAENDKNVENNEDSDSDSDLEWTADPHWEAANFFTLVDCYLWATSSMDRGIMQTRTTWRYGPMPHSRMICRLATGGRIYPNWRVWEIFRQYQCDDTVRYGETLDPDKPHAVATLADDSAIREDMLSTSELITILYLVADGIHKYKDHRFIPGTIISGSYRTFRIVQGVLDCQKGTLEIRKSQPIVFTLPLMENWEKFMTIIGWILGNPVGQTK